MKYDPDRKVIFIVEDNELHQMYLDHYLGRDHQMEVFAFGSGEECLENLGKDPDVIILDYYLEGMSGLETLRAIRECRPDIPVAIVSGQPEEEIRRMLLEQGAWKYVQKNHDSMQGLIQAIDDLLDDQK